ncbi:cytidylate kinase-like family protein [Lachnospiraceae bacterium MD1]|uniref:Cytidylate kinase-like family protein n=1 Tax=Variimorphobacter saccharofermentans TaxID=2755051 RepID=A0A839JW85_9FIRM|nr:cytidylate kinase-like family protein [Variimorphobacter saccharofermentans]MBB2181935.1 cytidylate kinase-like family protein [Variimorphobacter saccharofermentans]
MNKYVITIARGYGSGGRTIGKMLSEKLGIPYYDRDLLRLASDDSGINQALFAKADEKLKKSLLFRIASNVYKGELIPPDSDDFVSNDNLFNYQAKIIKELANTESCIIIGRCADYVLKDYENVIKVFVHAPMEDCIKTLKEMTGKSDKEIEKQILSIDKHRAEYYKYYTGRDWKNAENYDLCLNSSRLGFDKCVEIVQSYMDIRFR